MINNFFTKSILLLTFSLVISNSADTNINSDYYSLSINNEGPIEGSFNLDLGLGDNVLSGLEKSRDDMLDKIFDGPIETLNKVKKNNIIFFNSLMGNASFGEKLESKWMDFLGADDFFNSMDAGLVRAKAWDDKYNMQASNGILSDFHNKINKNYSEFTRKVNESSIYGNSYKEWEKEQKDNYNNFLKENGIEVNNDSISYSFFKADKENRNLAERILSGESASLIYWKYYKNLKNKYSIPNELKYFSKNSVQVNSDLCSILRQLFSSNKAARKEARNKIFKETAEFQKKFQEMATMIVAQTLFKETGVLAMAEIMSKMASCSMQATIATAANMLGIDIPNLDILSGLTQDSNEAQKNVEKTADSGDTEGEGWDTDDTSGDTSSTVGEGGRSIRECLDADDANEKIDTSIEGDAGIGEARAQVSPWIPIATSTPFTNFSASFKGTGDWMSSIPSSIQKFSKCIAEGKTSVWRTTYRMCLAGELSFNLLQLPKISFEINKIKAWLSKNKAAQCKIRQNAKKTHVLGTNFMEYFPKDVFNGTPWESHIKSLSTSDIPDAVEQANENENDFSPFFALIDLVINTSLENQHSVSDDKTDFIIDFIDNKSALLNNSCFKSKTVSNGVLIETPREFSSWTDYKEAIRKDCNTFSGGIYKEILDEHSAGLDSFYISDAQGKSKQSVIQKMTLEEQSNLAFCKSEIDSILYESSSFGAITPCKHEVTEEEWSSLTNSQDQELILKFKSLSIQDNGIEKEWSNFTNDFRDLSAGAKISICLNLKKESSLEEGYSKLYYFCKQFKLGLFENLYQNSKNMFKVQATEETGIKVNLIKIENEINILTEKYNLK